MLAGDLREDLFVDMFGIKRDIDAGDVLVDQSLHPALGLGAVESMAHIAGERVAEILQVGNQLFQRGFVFVAQLRPGGIAAEGNFVFVPAGEGEPAEPQNDLLGVRRGVGANRLGAKRDEWRQGGRSAVEEELRRRGSQLTRPQMELDYINRLLKQF